MTAANMVNCNNALFIFLGIMMWFGKEIMCSDAYLSRSDFEYGNKSLSRIAFGSCMK